VDQLIIESGTKLEGKIRVNGSKNAILPILAGSLLTEEEVIIENVPSLKDVQIMGELV
jgi:UDP-N-acetylglucosamine 1-carboxyvinyltransferase